MTPQNSRTTQVGPIYEHSELALRRAFDVFDRDRNGSIEEEELKVMMTKLGLLPKGDAGALRKMFVLADSNKDGKITFDEFVKIFKAEPS